MTTINDLLRSRTNDAIDEDLKQYRRVVDLTRRQLDLWNTTDQLTNEITSNEEDELNKNILSFSSTLDDYVNKFESGDTTIQNITLLTYKYNLLSNVLQKIKLNTLPTDTKNTIYRKLDDLMPKLEELMRVGELYGLKDRDIIARLFNEFNNHSYKQIPVSNISLTEEKFKTDTLGYNTYAKELKDLYEVVLSNKSFVSDDEMTRVDDEIKAQKELNLKLKKEGLKTITQFDIDELKKTIETLKTLIEGINRRQAEFNVFYDRFKQHSTEYSEILQKAEYRVNDKRKFDMVMGSINDNLQEYKRILNENRASYDRDVIDQLQSTDDAIVRASEDIPDLLDDTIIYESEIAPRMIGDTENPEDYIDAPIPIEPEDLTDPSNYLRKISTKTRGITERPLITVPEGEDIPETSRPIFRRSRTGRRSDTLPIITQEGEEVERDLPNFPESIRADAVGDEVDKRKRIPTERREIALQIKEIPRIMEEDSNSTYDEFINKYTSPKFDKLKELDLFKVDRENRPTILNQLNKDVKSPSSKYRGLTEDEFTAKYGINKGQIVNKFIDKAYETKAKLDKINKDAKARIITLRAKAKQLSKTPIEIRSEKKLPKKK
jgi:hypothetical protein